MDCFEMVYPFLCLAVYNYDIASHVFSSGLYIMSCGAVSSNRDRLSKLCQYKMASIR